MTTTGPKRSIPLNYKSVIYIIYPFKKYTDLIHSIFLVYLVDFPPVNIVRELKNKILHNEIILFLGYGITCDIQLGKNNLEATC